MPTPPESSSRGELGLVMTARIALVTVLGTLVSSAIVVAVPLVVVEKVRQGAVQSFGDAAGEVVSFLLALLLLAVALRGFFRTRRALREGRSEPLAWLARAVPACVLVGAAAGVWFALRVLASHTEVVEQSARTTCTRALGLDASDEAITACVAVGLVCDRQADDERRGKPDEFYLDASERPEVRCVREKLGVAK